jgi:hypothetical protein
VPTQLARLELLREEQKIAAEASKRASSDLNRCDVALANAENQFARTVFGYLGEYGTKEMVSLTQQIWRRRIDAEKVSAS